MNQAEANFKAWLDKKNYSYLFIDQTSETFPEFFREFSKRPDFLVVINQICLIAVDVKEKEPHKVGGDFLLDELDQIEKYLSFERITRLPVWIVFSPPNGSFWHWISLSEVLECPLRTSQKYPKPFRAIAPTKCRLLQPSDSISRIIFDGE